jgi:hypothetical protein
MTNCPFRAPAKLVGETVGPSRSCAARANLGALAQNQKPMVRVGRRASLIRRERSLHRGRLHNVCLHERGELLTTAERNRWAVLALLGTAQLMVVLDSTIVNIALPSAQRALHFSIADREWIVTAYALAFGSLLLLGGKLGDLFGRKWTFIAGLSGFAIVSAIGGMSQSYDMLVGARALQGMFGALLAPSALGLLTITFRAPRTGRRRSGSSARSPVAARRSVSC